VTDGMLLRAVLTAAALPVHVLTALLSVSMVGCGSDAATIGGLLCPEICRSNPSDTACPAACISAVSECGATDCTGDAAIDPCVGDSGPIPLTRRRLDLLMVMDGGVLTWWPYLADGLNEFLEDPASAGVAVGLQHFADSCAVDEYVTPVVPIAPLPENATALQQAIVPTAIGLTATIPAVEGALRFARDWAETHLEAHVAVLVVTDATPSACDSQSGDLNQATASVARAGLEGTPAIPTYVVGLGPMPLLDVLAQAGGTQLQRVPFWPPQSGEIAAALGRARDDARPCAP
jgi:hypothetical protein